MSADLTTPPAAKDGSPMTTLSAREQMILGKAWGCLKSGAPEIDFEKLAAKLGMTNSRSASNAWGLIKKKMAPVWGAGPPSTGKGTNKRKKRTKAAYGDSDADETPAVKKLGGIQGVNARKYTYPPVDAEAVPKKPKVAVTYVIEYKPSADPSVPSKPPSMRGPGAAAKVNYSIKAESSSDVELDA